MKNLEIQLTSKEPLFSVLLSLAINSAFALIMWVFIKDWWVCLFIAFLFLMTLIMAVPLLRRQHFLIINEKGLFFKLKTKTIFNKNIENEFLFDWQEIEDVSLEPSSKENILIKIKNPEKFIRGTVFQKMIFKRYHKKYGTPCLVSIKNNKIDPAEVLKTAQIFLEKFKNKEQ
ncbi:hypothetical protein Dip510_000508 [Elusimicrobium posterum]|uniref:hypothetical protein n=1 Tax=Elusimicrobium posterum TaxID=3116653 RepID=UPI003C770CE0